MDALEFYTMRNVHAYDSSTMSIASILFFKHEYA